MTARFCESCGTELGPAARFCGSCGNAVVERAEQIPVREPARARGIAGWQAPGAPPPPPASAPQLVAPARAPAAPPPPPPYGAAAPPPPPPAHVSPPLSPAPAAVAPPPPPASVQPQPTTWAGAAPPRPRRGPGRKVLAGVLVTVIVGGLAVAIFPGSLPLPGGPDGPLAAGTVAPGESPPIEPGPDLGGGWTTAPDPSLLIELPGGLHVASDQLLVTLDGGESAARSLAALVDGEVVGHVEAFGVWKIGFAPVLDVGAWQARYDAVAAVPGVTAVSSVGLEIPYGDCAAALGDKVYAGNGTASYDMIGVGGAWAAWYASGVPKHPVHIGVIDSPLTKDPKGRINWEFDNATWAGEPQTVAEPADKTEEPFESGFHHADMVMGILAGDLSDGGTAGVASVLGSNAILSHATMGEAPREGEATGWEAAPGVTYTDHEMLNIVEQVEAGATIINLSLGPEKPDASLAGYAGMYRTFFDTMAKQHPEVLFVIAAGNEAAELDGHNSSAGIAAPNVITVANVTTDGKLFDKSNRVAAGSDGEVTIAAPGHEAVWGMGVDKQPQKRYGGTSAAAPMVSGTAALIRSIDPSLSAAGVKKILVDSAAAKEGGAVLSADAAVLSAVNGVRDRQGKPRLTKADVAKATDTCVLKVNALISERHDDGTLTWTITSKLDAGTEPTAIALVVNGLRPSNWRQPVTRPDQVVTWTVRVPAAGVPITVTRLDNGFWRGFTLRESAAKPTAAPTARPTAKPTAKPKATARPTPAPPSGIDCSNPPPEGTIAYMKWSLGCGGAISP